MKAVIAIEVKQSLPAGRPNEIAASSRTKKD
jgi:hypothetical protein